MGHGIDCHLGLKSGLKATFPPNFKKLCQQRHSYQVSAKPLKSRLYINSKQSRAIVATVFANPRINHRFRVIDE